MHEPVLSKVVHANSCKRNVTVYFCLRLLSRQVDKLVQVLESPIFLQLRLQLLDVESSSYPNLLKSLYGILMLLPQVGRRVDLDLREANCDGCVVGTVADVELSVRLLFLAQY